MFRHVTRLLLKILEFCAADIVEAQAVELSRWVSYLYVAMAQLRRDVHSASSLISGLSFMLKNKESHEQLQQLAEDRISNNVIRTYA